jgi:hypothetical protein
MMGITVGAGLKPAPTLRQPTLDFFPLADDRTDKIIKLGFEIVCRFPHDMVVLAGIKVNIFQFIVPDAL